MSDLRFMEGGGEMRKRTRAFDWSSSILGPVEDWPQSLRTAVSIVLSSRYPMFLWWGPELIQFYNDAYRPSLGNEGKHPGALGQRGEDCWPEIWPVIKPLIDQVQRGEEATWAEDQLIPIYRNGSLEDVYWTFSYSPVYDELGKIGGVLVVCSETTDKVKSIQEIKRRNDDYQFVIDATELGTWDYDPVKNIITCSDRTNELFGFSRGEAIDLSMAMNAIIEKDRDLVAQSIRDALASGSDGIYDVEYSVLNIHDKKKRTIRAKGRAVFDEDGNATRLSGTAQDITREMDIRDVLQKSENNIRNIFINAPVAMAFLRGSEFIIDMVNTSMLKFWNKQSDEVTSKPLFETVPEISEQGFDKLLKEVYKTGIPFIGKEYPAQTLRKGKLQTVYTNFVYEALRDIDGSITGIVVVANEITELVQNRKKIEETVAERTQNLKEANLQLHRSNAELEQFAYVASHDLQEPLRKIKTFAGMLNNSGALGEKEKGFLDKIISSSDRMSVLIDDVLTFSRLSEKINNTVNTDLNKIIHRVKEDLELEIEQKNVIIESDELPVIQALPVQMNQLFFNLFSNSLKFSRQQERLRIKITAKEIEDERKKEYQQLKDTIRYVEIVFSDNGIGFDPQYADKIFNIFQRLNGRTYPGSGIGLALCKRIVANHGGELFATGEENSGAAFHIILPLEIESKSIHA